MRLITCLALIFLNFTVQKSLGAVVGEWDDFPISHRITGTVSFPNPNTIIIENFSYDGLGIRVFLYSYRPGQAVDDISGTIIPVRNGGSRGSIDRAYENEQIVADLPEGLTACDIETLTVWCEPFAATFSRITVPRTIFIENGETDTCQLVGGDVDLPLAPDVSFDNCESFADDTVQVSWTVDNANSEVDFQICSCRPTEAGTNSYMAFGLSGRSDFTFMIGADATVAWVDSQTGVANAVDYFLTERSQCRSGEGACPDTEVTRNGQRCTDNVRSDSIEGGISAGNQQCVLFSRPFTTTDSACDINFDPANEDQYIVWANGPLGTEPGSDLSLAFRHFTESSVSSSPVHLGRTPVDRCTATPIVCSSCLPFEGRQRVILNDTTLNVRIGPSASTRGYTAITGLPAWGIAWWIDDVLIPELVVARNRTYTFIIEGGDDPAINTQYHPFYITDSMSGGRLQNDVITTEAEIVYAGFNEDDEPTAVGRYCEYTESTTATNIRESCGSYEDYLAEVGGQGITCTSEEPAGRLVWTPNDSTPDVVYYQCASHLNLGWRIIVMDPDDDDSTVTVTGGTVATDVMVTSDEIVTRDDDEMTTSDGVTTGVTVDDMVSTDGTIPSHSLLSLSSLLLLVTLSWNI